MPAPPPLGNCVALTADGIGISGDDRLMIPPLPPPRLEDECRRIEGPTPPPRDEGKTDVDRLSLRLARESGLVLVVHRLHYDCVSV